MNTRHAREAINFYFTYAPNATPVELINFALLSSRRIAMRSKKPPEISAAIQLRSLQLKLQEIILFLNVRDNREVPHA